MNEPTDPVACRAKAKAAAAVVPLADLLALARLGSIMRKKQTRYFQLRREQPHMDPRAALTQARNAEAIFDEAVQAALERERVAIPGMEEGGAD